jgi:iron complex transport system substrate-binding protein
MRRRALAAALIPALAALALAASATGAPAAAAEKPRRIASLNVCVDQLLLLMAEKPRIASLTYWAVDPGFSNMAAEARGFPLNRGRAEDVLAARPDLVIAGDYTGLPTVALLRRVGVRVETLPLATDLAGVRANIARVAALIGEPEKGAAILADFDRRLGAVRAAGGGGRRPVVALYQTSGYTATPGSLGHAVFEAAGFENLAARQGLTVAGRLSIETVATAPLDALIVSDGEGAGASLNRATLDHPALKRRLATLPHIVLPSRILVCDTPHIVEAVERTAALAAVARARKSP